MKTELETTNRHLAEVPARLSELRLVNPDSETEDDRATVITQVEDERAAVEMCRNLLEALHESTQAVVDAASRRRDEPRNIFGKLGKGMQMQSNFGTSNNTFTFH